MFDRAIGLFRNSDAVSLSDGQVGTEIRSWNPDSGGLNSVDFAFEVIPQTVRNAGAVS